MPHATQTESCVKTTCLFEDRRNGNRVRHELRRSKKKKPPAEITKGGWEAPPVSDGIVSAALFERTAPAMCFHLPGLEHANRNGLMTGGLCGRTAGGASVGKLMRYPSTLHRQLPTLQHISGKAHADDPPPPPPMFKTRRAWLQVAPVPGTESFFNFPSRVCRFLGLHQMMEASLGSAGMTGCLINFKYIMFSQLDGTRRLSCQRG